MFGDFAFLGYTEVICIKVGRTRYGEKGEDAGLARLGSQVKGCKRRDSAGPHSGHSGVGGVPNVDH